MPSVGRDTGGGCGVAKRFRVAFQLDTDSERLFESVENKTAVVAQAVEFYFLLRPALAAVEGRLASIETRLASGLAGKSSEVPERVGNDTEDKIDSLIRKTLAF
jgi:hypothetical protein